jgi:hypothetical protein
MSDVEARIEQWRAGLADSEAIGPTDLEEMENHLREEITHLQATGLSGEEAFLVARRRLGDPAALEAEFLKVSPHRRIASHLSWMPVGVLAYLSVSNLSECVTYTSAWMARAFALPQPYINVLACVVYAMTFAGIGVLSWRYWVSHSLSQEPMQRGSISIRVGVFAAFAAVATWWADLLYRVLLATFMPTWDFGHLHLAQAWASVAWAMLMPILAAGLIVWLVAKDRHRLETR